jgi:uncharacterized protein YjbI with pentapeptide repeats
MSFTGNPEHLKVLMEAIEKKEISIWNNFNTNLIKQKKSANLRRAKLQEADLQEANLQEADLRGADLQEVYLQKADLLWADLIGAKLQKANLLEADLRGADLIGADLRGAKLQEADLRGAYLQEANLLEAYLIWTKLQETDMRGADLHGAYLWEADLRRADLRGAYLQGAYLRGADLRGADLSGVNLFRTNRESWIIKDIKCDYIYFDSERKKRIPEDRNFKEGEFEKFMIHQDKNIGERLDEMIKKGRGMNHVFISYVTEDKEAVIRLKEDLEKNHIKVWMDRYSLQPGVDWEIAIENAINNGTYFIACFSANYFKKTENYMNEELNIAIERCSTKLSSNYRFIRGG